MRRSALTIRDDHDLEVRQIETDAMKRTGRNSMSYMFDDPPEWDDAKRQRWYVVRDWIVIGLACAGAAGLIAEGIWG